MAVGYLAGDLIWSVLRDVHFKDREVATYARSGSNFYVGISTLDEFLTRLIAIPLSFVSPSIGASLVPFPPRGRLHSLSLPTSTHNSIGTTTTTILPNHGPSLLPINGRRPCHCHHCWCHFGLFHGQQQQQHCITAYHKAL